MNNLFYLSGGLALYAAAVFVFVLSKKNIVRNIKNMNRSKKKDLLTIKRYFTDQTKYNFIISLLILFFNIGFSYILLEFFQDKLNDSKGFLQNSLVVLVVFIIFLIMVRSYADFSVQTIYYSFGALSFIYLFYVVYKSLQTSNIISRSSISKTFDILAYLSSHPIKYIVILVFTSITYLLHSYSLVINGSPETYRFLGKQDKKYYLNNGKRQFKIKLSNEHSPFSMTLAFSLYLDALQYFDQFDESLDSEKFYLFRVGNDTREILTVYVSYANRVSKINVEFLPDNDTPPIITFDNLDTLYQSLAHLKIVCTDNLIALYLDDKIVDQKNISYLNPPDLAAERESTRIIMGNEEKLLNGYITNAFYRSGYEKQIYE